MYGEFDNGRLPSSPHSLVPAELKLHGRLICALFLNHYAMRLTKTTCMQALLRRPFSAGGRPHRLPPHRHPGVADATANTGCGLHAIEARAIRPAQGCTSSPAAAPDPCTGVAGVGCRPAASAVCGAVRWVRQGVRGSTDAVSNISQIYLFISERGSIHED